MVEVERTIKFFRAITTVEEDGTRPPFPHQQVIARLRGVPPTFPGRYIEESGGYLFGFLPADSEDRLVFVRSRRVGLPQVDEAGEFSPLNIPTTSGIAEVTHVRFFDDNLIAADFNFHGPPVSALSSYFRRTCNPVCPNVKFAPLLSQVALDQMDSMDTIKLARVRVARPYIATLQAASASLNASFASAAEVGGAEDFELVLRPQKYTGGTLNAIAVKQLWRRLRGLNEEHLAILELKVEGRINDTDVLIDLLSDKLIVKKQVIQINERSRAIDPASAFAAIGEAFDEVESIARMAPALGFGIPDDA